MSSASSLGVVVVATAVAMVFVCMVGGVRGGTSWKMTDRFYGFRFEVHGKVQGVWFRKHTQEMADKLFCFGWVQNTYKGTVVGEARCNKKNGPKFQKWLHTGSPLSNVEKVNVHVYEDTKIKLHFSDFPILDDERETCFQNEPHKCEPRALSGEAERIINDEL